jgi:hypothetical protein
MADELFHIAHYNVIAKEIRELFEVDNDADNISYIQAERTILTSLALNLCRRFKVDNPRFDPIWFLTACSPDNDLYPLSELWRDGE